jgi:two-component system phosphate regulon sensor histidine kinase PhoR
MTNKTIVYSNSSISEDYKIAFFDKLLPTKGTKICRVTEVYNDNTIDKSNIQSLTQM